VDFEALKLAASVVLLSPFIPLLFMGEEYGETSPFPYFISHSDEALIEAVREGRKRDFASFQWSGELMDPQDEATYLKAKLSHQIRFEGHHKVMWNFYRELIRLRKSLPSLSKLSKDHMDAEGDEEKNLVWVRRWTEAEEVCCLFHFGKSPTKANIPLPPGLWKKLIDSADEHWLGPGAHVPPTLASRGSADLTLLPNCFILLVRKD
jgi:maltooligosyltrehalose trehalohydrolase